jgi:nucleoside-diphosphate-sugar epimerase
MKVLVTGSNGFIGSHLAAWLVGHGHEVACLVRRTSRTASLDGLGVVRAVGDILDRASLDAAVLGREWIFHVAGVVTAADRRTYFEVNTEGTRNLVEACLKSGAPDLRKFVFVSSMAAAGPSPPGAALDEDAPCRPVSDYGRSKLAAEEIVLAARDRLPVTAIRPPNVLGPRQKELADAIRLMKFRLKPVIGTAETRTSIVSVEDLARALALAAEKPQSAGRVYYVTDGRAYTWRDITAAIAEAVGLRRPYLPVPYAAQYALAAAAEALAWARRSRPLISRELVATARRDSWVCDGSRIRRELGFEPEMDMRAAVRATVDWERERLELKRAASPVSGIPSRGGEGCRLEDPRPWRGGRQGAEGEARRSDPQNRGRALEGTILINIGKKRFIKIARRCPAPGRSAGHLPGRSQESAPCWAIPEHSQREDIPESGEAPKVRRSRTMKILVTGATGFVGSVLIPELIRRFGSANVSAFVLPGDTIPGTWSADHVRVIRGDIADPGTVSDAIAGHARVIHLAGYISYWKRDKDRLMRVNRDGAAAVVEACLTRGVERLVHVSTVGAIGFHKDGTPADEETPYNWPEDIGYMASKHEGQKIVERAARKAGLPAIILNPASIMGPGDHQATTPHNRLYRSICRGRLFGSFSGGLAIVDVRDLAALILKALDQGIPGEKYLAVGANLAYAEVIRMISRCCGRRAFPFRIPAGVVTAAGGALELVSAFTGRRPLLTASYGRLSGWFAYYANDKSRREFAHEYIPAERTIADGWAYYRAAFGGRGRGDRGTKPPAVP